MLYEPALRFAQRHTPRPEPAGLDVTSSLRHFSIVSWAVPPERLRARLHPRLELDLLTLDDGRVCALVSAVSFENHEFQAAAFPTPAITCGQTNYRVYVRDRETGQPAVWFLGTALDSFSVVFPKVLWDMPWHRARMRFACQEDPDAHEGYARYELDADSDDAPARLALEGLGVFAERLEGLPDVEEGLVWLTHPFVGFYDDGHGGLHTYSVWHEPVRLVEARVVEARFGLLDALGVVPHEEQGRVHSALTARRTDYTIYLPPKRVP